MKEHNKNSKTNTIVLEFSNIKLIMSFIRNVFYDFLEVRLAPTTIAITSIIIKVITGISIVVFTKTSLIIFIFYS